MNAWFLFILISKSKNIMMHTMMHTNELFCNKTPPLLSFENIHGNDMRPPPYRPGKNENENVFETPFDTILNNHKKNEWLKKLESNENEKEKLDFIKNEMESTYRIFDILGGGLFNDWFS